MHLHSLLPIAALLNGATYVYASLNGPCDVYGVPGVCVLTASCADSGGHSTTGFCPQDPEDIRCCTKTACGDGGSCKWVSECSGTTVTGLCPGPDDFKCCIPRKICFRVLYY